jgi:2-desacetyl-2-hydroxyethyl bacteriochlorophyllide A dehydrogenase
MRALVCEQPGTLTLTERPDPRPREGEAIIRIRRVGVCGTDFHIFAGKHPYLAYPRIMGHELAGEVAHAPPGSALRQGQTVYIVPYIACGHCRACRRGLTNACRNLSVLGVHQDGGMAEYLAVPEVNVIAADGLSLDDAATVEFLAIGAHGISRGAVTELDRVLVIGAGPIGMSAIIFAAQRGAQVTALDTRQDRLDVARTFLGAQSTTLLSDQTQSEFEHATDGDLFDVVVDATGNAASIRRGLDFVGHGGRHVLLSVVRDDLVFPDPEFHKRETTLLASRNALPADFAHVVSAIRAGRIPTEILRTHRAPLSEAATSFPAWLRPEAGVIKAILDV